MASPLSPLPGSRTLVLGAGFLLTWLASGLLACAKPEARTLSITDVERDRGARAELEAAIAEDHAALATLIASDRFETPSAIHADPELRAIALRLVERTRRLGRLAETDVLTPGAP